MKNKISCFENLIIWKKAQDIAVKIYEPAEQNDFSLNDQFRSTAISISDIIADSRRQRLWRRTKALSTITIRAFTACFAFQKVLAGKSDIKFILQND